jgi:IstB-like ATP binding protein
MAQRMAKLSTIKTIGGFDFSFQPSLDRNRILALAQLDFIDRNEVIHFRPCEHPKEVKLPAEVRERMRRDGGSAFPARANLPTQ